MPACDERDWAAIHSWARNLVVKFAPALSQPGEFAAVK
jgi:hypothetical protein